MGQFKAGSKVHIAIHPLPCEAPLYISSTSTPQRIAPHSSTVPADEAIITDDMESIESEMIQSTSIYTISGQLLQTIEGGRCDASHLPSGMYILQHRMSDGSIRSKKIANQK